MNRDEKVKEKLETISEGNKYLYDALCSCYDNGINAYSCSAGHRPNKLPYFAIIINEENIDFIRSIIASLQDMKNISMEYTARLDINNKLLKNGKSRGFIIRGALNNRCEMFYKINEGIKNHHEHPNFSTRAEVFFGRVEIFSGMGEEEIEDILEHGRVVSGKYTNNSKELEEYNEQIHDLKHNPLKTKISQEFTKKGKKEKEKFEQLDKIYGIPQNEYVPSLQETLKEQINYNKEDFFEEDIEDDETGILLEEQNDPEK